jgi:hypothetical protein
MISPLVMKIPPPVPLVKKFLDENKTSLDTGGINFPITVERLVTGILFLERPSPNKIHNDSLKGPSKKTFYNHIHALAGQMPALFREILARMQADRKLAMKKSGVLIIDEHIVPHTSSGIEGVDYFHSTTEQGPVLGMSLMAVHYYSERVEYPADFAFYRRERELQERGDVAEFKEKNAIARELFSRFSAVSNAPELWVMDAYFMTKENAILLKGKNKIYISRPKRNWKCKYQHVDYFITDLYDAIPQADFKLTQVIYPKSGKRRFYHVATVDVFFSRIGTHRLLLVQVGPAVEADDILAQETEILEAPSKAKFVAFCTNCTEWDASYILGEYSLRWAVETSFQDMTQNLALRGCKWRELSGQNCFLALAFLCYLFLAWAQVHGELAPYGVRRGSLGKAREAFQSYCQEEFSNWLADLKQQCQDCLPANYILAHLHDKEAGE